MKYKNTYFLVRFFLSLYIPEFLSSYFPTFPMKHEMKCFRCQEVGDFAKGCTKPKKVEEGKVNVISSNLDSAENKQKKKSFD